MLLYEVGPEVHDVIWDAVFDFRTATEKVELRRFLDSGIGRRKVAVLSCVRIGSTHMA